MEKSTGAVARVENAFGAFLLVVVLAVGDKELRRAAGKDFKITVTRFRFATFLRNFEDKSNLNPPEKHSLG